VLNRKEMRDHKTLAVEGRRKSALPHPVASGSFFHIQITQLLVDDRRIVPHIGAGANMDWIVEMWINWQNTLPHSLPTISTTVIIIMK
jgi:hypothetical protein